MRVTPTPIPIPTPTQACLFRPRRRGVGDQQEKLMPMTRATKTQVVVGKGVACQRGREVRRRRKRRLLILTSKKLWPTQCKISRNNKPNKADSRRRLLTRDLRKFCVRFQSRAQREFQRGTVIYLKGPIWGLTDNVVYSFFELISVGFIPAVVCVCSRFQGRSHESSIVCLFPPSLLGLPHPKSFPIRFLLTLLF